MLGMIGMAEPRALHDAGHYTNAIGKQHLCSHAQRSCATTAWWLDEHCP
jgi:arylsulfatase A-like enzyme